MVGKKIAVNLSLIGHLLGARPSLCPTHEYGLIISTLQVRKMEFVGD